MRIETNTTDRKLLAQAISERLGEPAQYMRAPTYAYRIGAVTVERDGAISCVDADAWAALTPFFESHGWLEQAREQMNGHLEAMTETIGPDPEAAIEPEAEEDSEAKDDGAITGTCVSVPYGFSTPANLINLLRTLYARQKLINAMTQSDKLFIDEELVTLLNDSKPDSREKICEILDGEIRANMVRGVAFLDDRICIEFPYSEEEPTRWQHYANLFFSIVRKAFEAHHVSATLLEPAETEMKYFCNSWLMQMGYGGHENKEARAVLMGHLKGYAAFRSADKMDAHKAKLTERRRAARQNAEVNTDETDR